MRLLFTISIFLISLNSFGQTVDYNRVILPNSSTDLEFSEKLVQLAWQNHPNNLSIKEQSQLSQIDLKLSKRRWLQNFKASANLNQINLERQFDNNAQGEIVRGFNQFPMYNFSVSFPLGDLFMNPLENKQYQILAEVSENEINATKLIVRRDVLQAYNNYLYQEEVYKIQRLAMDNAETNHAIIEESFEQGEETYERYTTSFNNLNQKKITILQAERDYKNAKLMLEEMIGIPLEDVN